jgi:hypothetical protein
MVIRLNWKALKGWDIRIRSAVRCLYKPHFVLVTWVRCEDGEIDYRITHKGVPVSEAVHRLKVDAAEILQDIEDQNCAIDTARDLLK